MKRRQAGAALAFGASLLAACTLSPPGQPAGSSTEGGSTGGSSTAGGSTAGGSTRSGGTTHVGAATSTGGTKIADAGGSPGDSESGAANGGDDSDPHGGAPASGGGSSAGTSSHDFCDPPCGANETCDRGMACKCDLTACPKACTNLQTDPKNCGTCGNVCSDQCFGGHCLKELTAVTNGGAVKLSVAKTQIYFTAPAQGTVSRIPIAGGTAVVLASAQPQPLGVVADDVNVYWVNQGVDQDGEVMKLARDGQTAATPLAQAELRPSAIAIDATNVYWTNDWGSGSVAKVPIAGGTRVELSAGDDLLNPQELFVNGAYVYWLNQGSDSNGSVMRVPVAGGTTATLVGGVQNPRFIAYYGASVYFAGSGPATGEIDKVGVSGGNMSYVATIARATPIAIDSSGIYCAGVGKAPGDIARISLDGTTVTTLASSPALPTAVALDASNVYWATSKGIYAVPK